GLHQGSDIFPQNSQGLQCTAMSATAIAYASVQNISTWTANILDEVLIRGEAYFQQQNQMRTQEESRLPMNTDDIDGYVNGVFGSFTIKISSDHGSLIAGMLNKFKTRTESPIRLNTAIQTFIDLGHTYGILTTAGYSMALVIEDNYLYFFDSHSRGPKGGVSLNGSSCVLKYELTSAKSLSTLVHKNVQPRSSPNLDDTR
ncbi:unnamed protein product, partial [Allacma fusca]